MLAVGLLIALLARDLPDAVAALEAGRLDEAVAVLGEVLKQKPLDPEANFYLGLAHLRRGRYDEAREPLENALRVSPPGMLGKIHRTAALNFLGLTQGDQAERHFREAIRLYAGGTPPEDDPRIDYGSFLMREGRTPEALRLLNAAVKSHPGSSRAHAELGKALLHTGDAAAAAARLEQAVKLNPNAWAARLVLGRAYQQLGRAKDAERELRLGQQGWSMQTVK